MLCKELTSATPAQTQAEARALWAQQIRFYLDMPRGSCTLRQAQCWGAGDLRGHGLVPHDCLPEFSSWGSLR